MIIDAAGSPREMGRAHGEQARDLIAVGLERWREELARSGKDADQLWKGLSRESGFRDAAARWAPGLLAEVEGIAEGANADPDAVFATNCLDEAWWWGEKGPGCSSVAVADRGGKPVIGQNMDLDTWMDTTQVALRLSPDDGPQQVLMSRAGVVGLCGANSEGVGLVVNALDQLPVAVDGLPVALVLRLLTAQTSLDGVEPLLRSIRHASGQSYTMASADGVLGFEAGGDFVASYRNDPDRPGARWHTNHPLVEGAPTTNTLATRTTGRQDRACRACRGSTTRWSSLDDRRRPRRRCCLTPTPASACSPAVGATTASPSARS